MTTINTAEIEHGAITISVNFLKLDEPAIRAIADARDGQFVRLSDGLREHHAVIGIVLLEKDGTLATFRACARTELDRRFGSST